ncbi:MAG TPA: hydroxyacid dehydrogenase [Aquificaceae bacterium]|nr:NADH-quinone oxidoreductase subunit J [Aquificaceae bacterium]MDM7266642.1 NADH-quinone oxidoreductase subunit J [Aquificaceae bacterium]QWK12468.1 MAG: NADH-quinone oxidoreductase subunit J [Aquificota bacterium]HAV40602.1 hydroxyacid dehydrogenase [Aquificaceae bacterium]HCO38438.1 hydroxyacid dehydrogenase [Aquificaceae bacterium]
MIQWIVFLLFSALAIFSALGVVFLPNPIYVILALLSVLVSVAGIFFVAGAELVGAIQLLIYAVAVAVFYVFVLTAVPWEKALKKDSHYRVAGVLSFPLILLLYLEMVLVFLIGVSVSPKGQFRELIQKFGNTEVVGVILFSKYFLAFELVSLVLLIGMIGAVLIGRKEAQVYEDDTP